MKTETQTNNCNSVPMEEKSKILSISQQLQEWYEFQDECNLYQQQKFEQIIQQVKQLENELYNYNLLVEELKKLQLENKELKLLVNYMDNEKR